MQVGKLILAFILVSLRDLKSISWLSINKEEERLRLASHRLDHNWIYYSPIRSSVSSKRRAHTFLSPLSTNKLLGQWWGLPSKVSKEPTHIVAQTTIHSWLSNSCALHYPFPPSLTAFQRGNCRSLQIIMYFIVFKKDCRECVQIVLYGVLFKLQQMGF